MIVLEAAFASSFLMPPAGAAARGESGFPFMETGGL